MHMSSIWPSEVISAAMVQISGAPDAIKARGRGSVLEYRSRISGRPMPRPRRSSEVKFIPHLFRKHT
jgi:hypothetical protein